jgi:hypothetical protein
MPLYYDTTAPTARNRNSITRTALDFGIRDFLLHLNIQNPIRYPQLSTSVNGSPRGGEPFLDTMVGSGFVPQQNPLEVDGVFRYANAIIMNLYKNQDPSAPEFLDIIDITTLPIFPVPPNGTTQYPTTPDSTTEQYGLLAKSDFAEYRKQATIKNLYLDATKQVDMADYISLQPIQTAQQLPSYDEAYGQLLGVGKDAAQAADILGSLLNGQGVGIAGGIGGAGGISVVPNFDLRSSLAGRVLGVAGVLNDTKLGTIGAEQLALALANNAAFNTEQAILGKLNLSENLLNLVQGDIGSIGFRPNYKITVSDDLLGKVVGTAERILGFTIPKSRLDDAGSIFFTESGIVSDTQRANSMLTNTGKGQRVTLGDQLKYTLLGTSEYDNPNESPFRSGYAPFYKGGGTRNFLVNGGQPKLYAFEGEEAGTVYPFIKPSTDSSPIPEISYRREQMVEDAGFTSPTVTNVDFLPTKAGVVPIITESIDAYGNGVSHIIKPTFSWVASTISGDSSTRPTNALPDVIGPNGDKKSLLGKTQKLFNSKGMINLVSVKGDMSNPVASQIQTSVVNNGISKGSAVLKAGFFSQTGQITKAGFEAENTFCRSWTTYDRFDTVSKLIRSRGLNQKEGSGGQIMTGGTKGWRLHNSERMSVLDDNGFVKIAPYKTDNLTRQSTIPKKYMFSIENLAWVGSPAVNLLPIEQGPGDLLTGKFGRIMWFPPYDLTFSESSSVSLESNLFIGRGEPLYTYNNTERTGNLSFKIVVDHPSAMNAFKGNNGPTDEYIRSWFAGCVDDDYFTNLLTKEEVTEITTRKKEIVNEKTLPPPPDIPPFRIYFKNDRVDVDKLYEAAPQGSPGVGTYSSIELEWKRQPDGKCIELKNTRNWEDKTSYALNTKEITIGDKKLKGWIDPDFAKTLTDYLSTPQYKDVQININAKGWASTQGCVQQNKILANERGRLSSEYIKSIVKDLPGNISVSYTLNPTAEKTGTYTSKTPPNDLGPKEARYAEITFNIDKTKIKTEKTITYVDDPVQISLNSQVKKRYYTEQDFFEKLTRDDAFVFDQLRKQIRYFHPAFHSTTPEGLNSRLTFLLQCTRQGPTTNTNENPHNLAFGPAPVCILRIGDFYNTKIMIDNLAIDYEPLVWDLNPEGVGVQPMIANVTISFKYIGGSSLYGPINKLQNALSFNYFANSQVYDPRADYIASIEEIKTIVKDYKGDNTRKTFGSITMESNPEANTETNYGLVPGLDSVNDSMGALLNKVPIAPQPTSNQPANSANNNQQTSPSTQDNNSAASSCQKDKDNLYWVNEKDEKLKPVRFFEGTIGFDFGYNDPAVQISQPFDWYVNVYDLSDKNIVYTAHEEGFLFYEKDKTTYDPKRNSYEFSASNSKVWGNKPPPQSLIDSGNYSVSYKLVGVTDKTCEIIFDTATGTVTKTETKCDTDGKIITIGASASDTTNPDLKVLKDTTKGNYISFFINATDKTNELFQDYKLTVTLISSINTGDRYVWKTPIDVSKAFMKSNSLVNNLYFSDTDPKTPQLIEGNEIPYSIEFKFVGVTDPCNYEIIVGGITNSQQEQESALKKLSVKDVTTANVNQKNGFINFNVYNDGDPARPELSPYKFNVKSTIKSADGLEQYQYIHLDKSLNDGSLFSFRTNEKNNGLAIPISDVTPPCTGLTNGKQYSLETLVYNDTTKAPLNTVALTNAINSNVKEEGVGVIGFKNITVDKIVQSTSKRTVLISLEQVGIFKEESGRTNQLLTDDELKAFINKGITIKIRYNSEPENGNFDLNKTLTDVDGGINSGVDALGWKTLLGDPDSNITAYPALVNFPVNGVYYFDLYYQNDLLETIKTLNIDDRSSIEYNANSAVTPAPATPTPVAASNSKDADVVNAISIKKVYPYETQYDSIRVDFEWSRKQDLPTFALQSSRTYKGKATITTKENGQRITIDLEAQGTFTVRRNDDTSVVFGSGLNGNNNVVLANTQNWTQAPSGKAWEIGSTWNCELELDELDEDKLNKIKAAQRNPDSNFQITWDTGSMSNYTFYLDNTPAPPPAAPIPANNQITINYLGEFSTLQGSDTSYFNILQTSGKYLVLRIIDPNYDFNKVGIPSFKNNSGSIVTYNCQGVNGQSCIVNDKKAGTYILNVDYYPNGPTNSTKLNLVSQPFTQNA